MTIEINGMAHVILMVSCFEVAREFYRKLLPEFGMKPVFDGDKLFYCVGARTAIGIEPCDPALAVFSEVLASAPADLAIRRTASSGDMSSFSLTASGGEELCPWPTASSAI